MTIDFKLLKAPFKNVSWRVGRKDKSGTKAIFMAYIDARDVFDRLDEVAGQENWQNKQEIMSNGSMKCSLSIKINDTWIVKEDGAGTRSTETEKSAYSDAIKRAAVLWGIGRYLYDVKTPYLDIDKYGNPTLQSKLILDKCLRNAENGIYEHTDNHDDSNEMSNDKNKNNITNLQQTKTYENKPITSFDELKQKMEGAKSTKQLYWLSKNHGLTLNDNEKEILDEVYKTVQNELQKI
jgi:hypothetical protein